MNLQGAVSKSAAEDYAMLVNILAAKEYTDTHTRRFLPLFATTMALWGRFQSADSKRSSSSSVLFSIFQRKTPKSDPQEEGGEAKVL